MDDDSLYIIRTEKNYYFKSRAINILFEDVEKSSEIFLDFILGGKVHPLELIKNSRCKK